MNKLFTGDCINELMKMNQKSVDLVCTDPPYLTNRDFGEFDDRWESDEEYLHYLYCRLLVIPKRLKDNWSLYIQCNPAVAHKIKVTIMDDIFGDQNFRSDITWKRFHNHNDAKKYANVKDTILFYSSSSQINYNDIRVPLDDDYVKRTYVNQDDRGRYMTAPLTSDKKHGGGCYNYDFRGFLGPWRCTEKKMKELADDSRIHMPTKINGIPRRKVYLHESKGKVVTNLWDDDFVLSGKEKTDYPTQKPVALYERMVLASSNEGDLVLDPFCGSGTTLVAAKKHNRNYIGIDINDRAIEIAQKRLDKLENSVF